MAAAAPAAAAIPAEERGLWIEQPLAAVRVNGLRATHPRVVLRELSASAGSPVDWNRLERDRLRLLDLGIFADVSLIPRRDPVLDQPVLDVSIRERPTVLALPTLEWEQRQGFTYGAAVEALNVGGMARAVALAVGVGAKRYAQGTYATRWAFGRRMAFAAQGSWKRTRNLGQGLVEHHSGGNVTIAPARGPYLSFPFLVGAEHVRVDPDPKPEPEFVGRAVSRRDDHRWAEGGLRIDTRDYAARPRRGEVLAVRAAAHGGLFGGTLALERYALDAMLVRSLRASVVTVASRTILSRGAVPSFLRLDLGGASDLRGHPPDFCEGDNIWFGWVEERFPLLPRREFPLPPPFSSTVDVTVDGAFFVDGGATWNHGDWERGNVRGGWGIGAGLRLAVPFAGLLSLDLATDGSGVEAYALSGTRF